MALELRHRNEGKEFPTGKEFIEFAKLYDNDYIVYEKIKANNQIAASFDNTDFGDIEINKLCEKIKDNNKYVIIKIKH